MNLIDGFIAAIAIGHQDGKIYVRHIETGAVTHTLDQPSISVITWSHVWQACINPSTHPLQDTTASDPVPNTHSSARPKHSFPILPPIPSLPTRPVACDWHDKMIILSLSASSICWVEIEFISEYSVVIFGNWFAAAQQTHRSAHWPPSHVRFTSKFIANKHKIILQGNARFVCMCLAHF